ncbi:uncharacterized protein LOC110819697 [Carica papaya]|uniref:uncharacterized protein LOC110819697 n=1 Tax=Carica papaya TaxID=3649 RepID=UPI000B8D0851|nr:uncharacterized protein LOC110819697 [Carica papaya]
MKQLVGFREEFADAQSEYLRALKNTGVTLRQFTESDSLELENTTYEQALPLSPPPPLPPSPPPPPPFSPDSRKPKDETQKEIAEEESMEIDRIGGCTPPPPSVPSSSWNYWDPFESLLPHPNPQKSETVEQIEEEDWAETQTEFEGEEQEPEVAGVVAVDSPSEKKLPTEFVDDNSSMMSWHTKSTAEVPTIGWRSKKTLEGIVKELDEYFLKASAGEKEIAILMDINGGDTALPQNQKENKRKRSNSARVFSALSWSWSSKSLQLARDGAECSFSEPCRPGAHSITLGKLYALEHKLYKEVKEEELTKLEHERKSTLLQKQEDENHDSTKRDKTRLSVESLESDITCLRDSISMTSSSILKLIDEELHPQLVALTSGLMHVWRTMSECHNAQYEISQQLNHLMDCQNIDLTTEYHRQAAEQLEAEVIRWYNSFCKLVKSQQDYVGNICKWIQLTDFLVVDHQRSDCLSAMSKLCEEWQVIFQRLPDKVAAEAIKSFLSAIQSIIEQEAEEQKLHKKSDKLEKRLQKELMSVSEMERKLEGGSGAENTKSNLSPNDSLSLKWAKIEALKKQVEVEKAKYLKAVEIGKTMSLNNLKTSLPNVFRALMGFASSYAQAFEAIHAPQQSDICNASQPQD